MLTSVVVYTSRHSFSATRCFPIFLTSVADPNPDTNPRGSEAERIRAFLAEFEFENFVPDSDSDSDPVPEPVI